MRIKDLLNKTYAQSGARQDEAKPGEAEKKSPSPKEENKPALKLAGTQAADLEKLAKLTQSQPQKNARETETTKLHSPVSEKKEKLHTAAFEKNTSISNQEFARALLHKSLGAEKAEAILERSSPPPAKPFEFLQECSTQELEFILKEESAPVLSLVLPHLPTKLAVEYLQKVPMELRVEVAKRIAKMEKVRHEIITRVAERLRERSEQLTHRELDEDFDGAGALAGILRHIDPQLEENLLSSISKEAPALSDEVRDRLFTMSDVKNILDRDFQIFLQDISDHELCLIMKGQEDSFKEKILSNISSGRRSTVLAEYEFIGAVSRSDVAKAQREFLTNIKEAWYAKKIRILTEEEFVE